MRFSCFVVLLVCCLGGAFAQAVKTLDVDVREYNGRPAVFVDGKPMPMAGYCPIGWAKSYFMKQMPRFYAHHMNYYQIMLPAMNSDLAGTQFWEGDQVSETPLFAEPKVTMQGFNSIDESAQDVIDKDPNAHLIIRIYMTEPQTWRNLHKDEYVVTEEGTVGNGPSMASDLYWEMSAKFSQAVVRHCESRPWANRIIGYVNLAQSEGCSVPVIEGWLFDHNPKMVARWRAFLRQKYGTVEKLRAAYNDQTLTFETVEVPKDKLRGKTPEVANLTFWQAAKDNQPLRDYLLLQQELFHQRYRQIFEAMRAGTDRQRLFIYDMLKQTMQGWNCGDFFYNKESRRLGDPDLMAGSGSMGVADIFDYPGLSGLLTPHDYQARGPGGVFEPEGIADSAVLRNKLFICEMDLRTYVDKTPPYGQSRNLREYEAVSWRNIATAITRGFHVYWMDLSSDWYKPDEIQQVIGRQVEVIKRSSEWPHETVPGIAMIIDDRAALETNGAGNFANDAVMWEQKMGMARCGVPYRIYLLDDLKLSNFPKHRVFYFPNMFKVDDERLALLKEKVFRDGNVVIWGPGSGISDGEKIGPESAMKLTGFNLRYWPVNHMHRTLISNFEHPITNGMKADCVIGGALSYGPLLFPTDGTELGLAWTKNGETIAGLAVKEFGKGARGAYTGKDALGAGDYASVFTSAMPLPADLWRNLARYAGTHIYSETNDVVMADNSVVALHSMQTGEKKIVLPGEYKVYDAITGKLFSPKTRVITFQLKGPETRVFRLMAVK
ncbi:MAG: hypothetical protein ACYDBB_04240 [Armatimonadota bacterium]